MNLLKKTVAVCCVLSMLGNVSACGAVPETKKKVTEFREALEERDADAKIQEAIKVFSDNSSVSSLLILISSKCSYNTTLRNKRPLQNSQRFKKRHWKMNRN